MGEVRSRRKPQRRSRTEITMWLLAKKRKGNNLVIFSFNAGTSWMSSSTYWTRRSIIISRIHSMLSLLIHFLCGAFIDFQLLESMLMPEINYSSFTFSIVRADFLLLACFVPTHDHPSFPSCSFVSVIHLLVGVVYCLVSWAVGLPKRAVSSMLWVFMPLVITHRPTKIQLTCFHYLNSQLIGSS